MIPAVFHSTTAPAVRPAGPTGGQPNQSILDGPQNQNGPDGAYDLVAGHFYQGDQPGPGRRQLQHLERQHPAGER